MEDGLKKFDNATKIFCNDICENKLYFVIFPKLYQSSKS